MIWWGETYLQNLLKSINTVIEIFVLTNNPFHRNIYIKEDDLVNIIEALDKIGFKIFQEGFYLWEKIYEKVRQKNHPEKPIREISFFLFDNIKDCECYIDKHKGGGTICEVEALETRSLFRADMNLLDVIPNNFTFKQAFQPADKYWASMTSNKIIYEYLFQGRCK